MIKQNSNRFYLSIMEAIDAWGRGLVFSFDVNIILSIDYHFFMISLSDFLTYHMVF